MITIQDVMDEYKDITINEEPIAEFIKSNGLYVDDSVVELQKTLKDKGMDECHEVNMYVEERIQQKIWDICEEFEVTVDYKWDYKW